MSARPCPACSGALHGSRFDLLFRGCLAPDPLQPGVAPDERCYFEIPGFLCRGCLQILVDPELLELMGTGSAACVMAIESARAYRARVGV